MRKIIGLIAIMGLCLFLFNQTVFAFDWVYNGDRTGDVASGFTVGASNIDDLEYDVGQPIQISGAGTLLPLGYPGFRVNFHFNGSTWDSYNEEVDDEEVDDHTGYLDVFAVVLSEEGYYWDLDDTDIHPLEDNPALILSLDPFVPAPDPTNSYWGGTSFEDGVLEDEDADVVLDFNTDPTKQYYLSLFMQTMEDEYYSSWGRVTNLNVTAVPEPVSTILFLTGGTILAVRRLRRR